MRYRLTALAGVAATALAVATLGTAGPAAADPVPGSPGTYPSGYTQAQILAGVGADADAELMNHAVTLLDASGELGSSTIASYDSVNPVTGAVGEPITTKPGCALGARPNGAGAGLSAILSNQLSTVDNVSPCIDWVRASRAKKSDGTENSLTFYAWAGDALDWVSLRNSYAPRVLSKDQLLDIFTCEVSDWSQVGGQEGAIHLYFAPSTAATFTEFLKAFGIADYNTAYNACKDSGRLFLTQQNDGRTLYGDPQGITGYAATKWAGQANGGDDATLGIPDWRGGSQLGLVGDTTPVVVSQTVGAKDYLVLNKNWAVTNADTTPDRSKFGRILFNTVRSSAPQSLKDIFDADSWLCDNQDALIVPFGATPLGSDTGASRYCGQPS